ncbi:MAG: SDR family NAD(P)-dependent oxidoreductase [Labrys sp. (in: a-proteobacteria)]|jgi:meso-butanediol dehydrogenase/(S,S)-butanediol dehydrogenase/diacetyl reductase
MTLHLGLSGKTALVTGAGRGLGFAIAGALIEQGVRVAVNDRTEDAARQAADRLGDGALAVAADLSTETGPSHCVDQALARLGGLDFVVNNAAINIENPIEQTTDDLWDAHLHVVLRAPQLIIARSMASLRQRRGAVLNVASELALHAIPNNVAYVAAKHGLLALTRAVAMEVAADGVRVNALCPGTMDTELMQECAAASGDPARYYAAFKAYHPIGRIASAREIANVALVMLSPLSAFMTGASIALDGGSTAGRVWGDAP